MNRNNHEDNTNKARHNIYEYAQKNSEKYIKKIDEMRSSKDRMTFKNSGKYLEVANNSTADGASVGQWESTGYKCQKWTLRKEGIQ